jgi:hypothetical protein
VSGVERRKLKNESAREVMTNLRSKCASPQVDAILESQMIPTDAVSLIYEGKSVEFLERRAIALYESAKKLTNSSTE